MAVVANIYSQNLVFNDLGTYTLLASAPYAGLFAFNGQLTLPSIVGGAGASQVVATVKQNGSTVYTGIAGATGFQTSITCALADAITVVLSSAATPDQPINVIKTNVAVSYSEA
jgi:hypothetical protein